VVFERQRYRETPRTKDVLKVALGYIVGRAHEARERDRKSDS
jgi:hypothetical protein